MCEHLFGVAWRSRMGVFNLYELRQHVLFFHYHHSSSLLFVCSVTVSNGDRQAGDVLMSLLAYPGRLSV